MNLYKLHSNPKKLFGYDKEYMLILRDGIKQWFKNGIRHRENGPARIIPDGAKYWYQNGKIHNDNGPAIKQSDGSEYWYKNGKFIDKK